MSSYGFSPKLPLKYDDTDGPYLSLKTIKDVGKQNLKMIILTNPGERVMDPTFGVGISRYLFNQEGFFDTGIIEQNILSQVAKYIPYVNITNIQIESDELNNNTKRLKISYFIPSFASKEVLYLDVDSNDTDFI
jgi:phage baseplate assembly protein W